LTAVSAILSSSWACYLVFKDRAVSCGLPPMRKTMLLNLGVFALLPDRHPRPSRSSSGARLLYRRAPARQPLCCPADFPTCRSILRSALCRGRGFYFIAASRVNRYFFAPYFRPPHFFARAASSGRGAASNPAPSSASTLFFGVDLCALPHLPAGSLRSGRCLTSRPLLVNRFSVRFCSGGLPGITPVARSLLQLDSDCQGTPAGVLPGRPPREGGRLLRLASRAVNNLFSGIRSRPVGRERELSTPEAGDPRSAL
jgi:hypothetical protein